MHFLELLNQSVALSGKWVSVSLSADSVQAPLALIRGRAGDLEMVQSGVGVTDVGFLPIGDNASASHARSGVYLREDVFEDAQGNAETDIHIQLQTGLQLHIITRQQ